MYMALMMLGGEKFIQLSYQCLKPSSLEAETATEQLEKYKSPGTGQIPGELNKAGGNALRPEVQKLINSIWNKNCRRSGRSI
jgi:hypothetical protein